MVRGGFRRKAGTFHYELRNDEIARKCKTNDINVFIARQQCKFVAHVIRGDNERLTKRVLFNSNRSIVPGRNITLYKTVLANEKCTPDTFHKNALSRKV